jgi:glycerophosphoryl diester phosphodiesterase
VSTTGVVLRLLPRLILLGTRIFLPLLLLALPFLAGAAVVWFTTLAGHDINYYLAERPPEWRHAKLFVAILGVGYAVLAVWQVSRWLFAVPVLLFEGVSPRAALKRSTELIRGRMIRTLIPLVAWWLLLTAVTLLITWVCRQVSNAGLDWAGIAAPRVLPLVAVYLVVSLVGAFHGALWLGKQLLPRGCTSNRSKALWQAPPEERRKKAGWDTLRACS